MKITNHTEIFQELGFFGTIKEKKWGEFVSAVQNNVDNSRKEPGNLAFSLYQSEENELQALWFERFKTKADHNTHKEQAYFKNAIAVIKESLAGEANSIELKELVEIPIQQPTQADEPEQTRTIVVLFNVKPEKRVSFIKSISHAIPYARKAQGNLEFNLYQYAGNSNQFVLIENWKNKAAHETHQNQEYSQKLNVAFKDMFVSNPMDTRWVLKDISVNKNKE